VRSDPAALRWGPGWLFTNTPHVSYRAEFGRCWSHCRPTKLRFSRPAFQRHSRSSELTLVDRVTMTSYEVLWYPLAYLVPFPRYSDICPRIANYSQPTLISTPPLRWFNWNCVTALWLTKQEWWGKKFDKFSCLWEWRTDGHRSSAIARLCTASRGSNWMIACRQAKPAALLRHCDAIFDLLWLDSEHVLQTNQHNGFRHCNVECWNLKITGEDENQMYGKHV